jgi:predicted type IV restriction endonuclease
VGDSADSFFVTQFSGAAQGDSMDEANAATELRAKLAEFAKRSVVVMTACTNEQSTKFSLVMPFLGLLGYDSANPHEVYPEHVADFTASQLNKVDLAVLKDGKPIIAVECKKVGTGLVEHRGQLRAHYNALVSAKLGILTNGATYEFFVDSDETNIVDEEPFLTLDLETIARAGATDEVIDALLCATKANFDAETISDAAFLRLTRKRLRTMLAEEASNPSEDFCRFALQRVGLKNVRKTVIDRYYGPMIKVALEEALLLPALKRVRTEMIGWQQSAGDLAEKIDQRIITTDRELAIFGYVRRRLAYLVEDEACFAAIDGVRYKDYVGKLRVFYCKEHKGHLFDYIEGADGRDEFIFPDPVGTLVTSNVREIDAALKATFVARVPALAGDSFAQRLARTA